MNKLFLIQSSKSRSHFSFFEKNESIKMAYFGWNKIYLYDLSKQEMEKLRIEKENAFISDLMFLNDSTLLYGVNLIDTEKKYTNKSKVIKSYLYAQGIGVEKYLSLEERG